MSSVSRRAALAAPLAALAGNLPSPATAADVTSPTLLEVRRLVPLVQAAIAREIALEGQPGYAEACAQAAALDDEIEALAVSVWATPARSWGPMFSRAQSCVGVGLIATTRGGSRICRRKTGATAPWPNCLRP